MKLQYICPIVALMMSVVLISSVNCDDGQDKATSASNLQDPIISSIQGEIDATLQDFRITDEPAIRLFAAAFTGKYGGHSLVAITLFSPTSAMLEKEDYEKKMDNFTLRFTRISVPHVIGPVGIIEKAKITGGRIGVDQQVLSYTNEKKWVDIKRTERLKSR